MSISNVRWLVAATESDPLGMPIAPEQSREAAMEGQRISVQFGQWMDSVVINGEVVAVVQTLHSHHPYLTIPLLFLRPDIGGRTIRAEWDANGDDRKRPALPIIRWERAYEAFSGG